MYRVLANDGIDAEGKKILEENGFQVDTVNVPQENLPEQIDNYDVLLVRSATKVRKDLIDTSTRLKVIGRAGVGMDNIDVEYARSKGLKVINTPEASSESVAELTISHLFSIVRFLYDSNRQMPGKGNSDFKGLKKSYSKGIELSGKTIGIIGLGRIGKAVAKRAIGLGMNVEAFKRNITEVNIELDFHEALKKDPLIFNLKTKHFDEVLAASDIVTLHVPGGDGVPLIDKHAIDKMKDGAILINVARGGVVDEKALVEALNSGKLSAAALDVFDNEPSPSREILNHPKISLSPHIGASTVEAQKRIGIEMAQKVINFFQTNETDL
ncbi:MAG: 3-phosphoglycerate dehydrogenase [Chitinophagaceae bacterium]|nr:MAG: 3-phosphoglycerate dehydrogenase [Chitinophagaceae bacterium]